MSPTRFSLRCLGALVLAGAVSAILAYVWLAVALGHGAAWIRAACALAVASVWTWALLACRPGRARRVRALAGAGFAVVAAVLIGELAVRQPLAAHERRVDETKRANAAYLAQALERRDCADGGALVIVPWLELAPTAGGPTETLLELRWIEPDRSRPSVLLARRPQAGPIRVEPLPTALRERLPGCLDDTGDLAGMIARLDPGQG